MNIPSEKQKEYTFGDYLSWSDEERWEIIDGTPYMMTPAPSSEHQSIVMELGRQIANYLQGKTCKVFPAPFDVRLPRGEEHDEEIDNVVQPDLVVVCDREKIDKRGCKGAPDLIIEIISQATAKKDLNDKFNLYERSGVKEYWVVFPSDKALDVYQLDENSKYQKAATYYKESLVKSSLFEDLELDLKMVFA